MQRRKQPDQPARIRVIGIGGGGSTAVNGMIHAGVFGVDFLAIDTDTRYLQESKAPLHIRIGEEKLSLSGTQGDPEQGMRAAIYSKNNIRSALHGSDLVFITAGLGGGTATGAAPIVARLAKEIDALVIGIVTFPFSFEGEKRSTIASAGTKALKNASDTLIVIPNDRLLELADGSIGFHETYRLAHEIWCQSIQGVSEIIGQSGLINVDFADVRTVMSEAGGAIIATGRGRGPDRARRAALQATRSELLGITIDGARDLLFNILGGSDMGLLEVEEAADLITSRVHPGANVIFGAAIDNNLEDEVHITVIATGFDFTTANIGSKTERRRSFWSHKSSPPQSTS